jgi:hypothetical protein
MKQKPLDLNTINDLESLKKIIVEQSKDIRRLKILQLVFLIYIVTTIIVMLYNKYA